MVITNTTTVRAVNWLAGDIFEVVMDKVDLPFKPGMAISVVGPDDKTVRSFSLASGTLDDHYRLIVKHVPGGKLSPYLAGLSAGDELRFRGPFGMFLVGKHKPFVYIATGTGITPLISYLRSFPGEPPLRILYGVRQVSDAVHHEELAAWAPTTLCVSREETADHHRGRVTDLLGKLSLDDATHFYLCGLDSMLFEVTDWLTENGMPKENIHMEVFFRSQIDERRKQMSAQRAAAGEKPSPFKIGRSPTS